MSQCILSERPVRSIMPVQTHYFFTKWIFNATYSHKYICTHRHTHTHTHTQIYIYIVVRMCFFLPHWSCLILPEAASEPKLPKKKEMYNYDAASSNL